MLAWPQQAGKYSHSIVFSFLYVISVKRLIASITAYVMQEFPQLFKGDIWLCSSGIKEQTTKLYFLKLKLTLHLKKKVQPISLVYLISTAQDCTLVVRKSVCISYSVLAS